MLAVAVAAFAAAAALLLMDAVPSRGQSGGQGGGPVVKNAGPRSAGRRPNLSGIWQAINAANWNIEPHPAQAGPSQLGALGAIPAGLGVVDGDTIPYAPSALAKRRENFEKRWTEDPEVKCYMPGVPRATYMPFPFQIIQGDKTILIAYEFASASRTIHLDRRHDAPADSWMGTSNGRWEGETLVVDVTGLNDQTWFDRAGNFHSDALHVVERYTPAGADRLTYEATIEDPNVFTRPWRIRMPLYRRAEKDAQLLEFKCVPFAEELLYGRLRRTQSQ